MARRQVEWRARLRMAMESDDRERGRKEECSDKKEEESRLRGRKVIAREEIGEPTTENMSGR